MFKKALMGMVLLILGCDSQWQDGPYQVYIIDESKKLGFALGGGGFIARIDEPCEITSNKHFIVAYACPMNVCGYYYIDKSKDHQFADSDEFVFGPFTESQYIVLQQKRFLPKF